ncbi:hypothetical protein [Streptomyces sp. NPDC050263]|uniref:hypothetical protein n=1 Tax=Streptomyces sp. NPDC050263 TaxID=3155037 RepID=UPI0034281DE6
MNRNRNAVTCGGCVLSVAGALTATSVWLASTPTRIRLGRGFENEGMDLTVLFTELPLVFLAGATLPALAYAFLARLLGGRRTRDDT